MFVGRSVNCSSSLKQERVADTHMNFGDSNIDSDGVIEATFPASKISLLLLLCPGFNAALLQFPP